MGVFKGRRRKGIFLATRKCYVQKTRFRLFSNCQKTKCTGTSKSQEECHSKSVKRLSPLKRSTPCYGNSKRRLTSSARKSVQSPLVKKIKYMYVSPVKFTPSKIRNRLSCETKSPHKTKRSLWYDDNSDIECLAATPLMSDDKCETDYDAEETVIYSEESSVIGDNNDKMNERVEMNMDTKFHELLNEAIPKFRSNDLQSEIFNFLELVSEEKFPLNNVAFSLFIDVVKWFSKSDTRGMRYGDTSMKFFWLGKKLFGSRFLRFMGGPKNETDILTGNPTLSPLNSKINFACPSDSLLRDFQPLGYDICVSDSEPGLIQSMIDLTASKNNDELSYVIMFDGKKIKRGTDMDLLGFESLPLKVKQRALEVDMEVIESTLSTFQGIDKLLEDGCDISDRKTQLHELLVKCFETISKYIMEMRKLRKGKDLALKNYREKVHKDPSQAKCLSYAIDSCRTSAYQVDICLQQLLEIQFEICKSGAYLNGMLDVFATAKVVDIERLKNVNLLQPVDTMKEILNTDTVPTSCIKQRSEEWFAARKSARVTGSSVYAAVGCDTLKQQNEHFDHVFNNKEKSSVSESQEKAMQHGVESEQHEIATLASVIIPFMFPETIFYEEGYYIKDNVVVSPDGSLRDKSGESVVYAFEGKAPIGNDFTTQQHYSVPERYITQTLFEDKALKAEKGTLYLCWTDESSTAFVVPSNNDIYESCQSIIQQTYLCEEPKRQTRLSEESKALKEELKHHVSKCRYIGEFPSAKNVKGCVTPTTDKHFTYSDLIKCLMLAKNTVKDSYNLKRTFASQAVVYLLADLDRMWKSELPHAVPVMYYYRGYSLPMDKARVLTAHCKRACEEKGLDVVAIASDGEFIPLMVRDRENKPLTMLQLSKDVWNDACKLKKGQLIKHLKTLNTQHTIVRDESGKLTLESVDGGSRINTSPFGWSQKAKRARATDIDDKQFNTEHQEDVTAIDTPAIVEQSDEQNSLSIGKHVLETDLQNETGCELAFMEADIINDAGPISMREYDSEKIDESDQLDETIEYDFEAIVENTSNAKVNSVDTVTEELATDLFNLFCHKKPTRWQDKSPDDVINVIHNSPQTLLKDELLSLAEYFGLTIIRDGKTQRLDKARKNELIDMLSKFLGIQPKVNIRSGKRREFQPKSLKYLSEGSLRKSSYPKQALNIAYAEYVWPTRLKNWRESNKVENTIVIKGEEEDMEFEPYYVPEYDDKFRVYIYDKTHLGTNLRKCVCLDKVENVSIEAWRSVSKSDPKILHPTLIEVSPEGKILDQMRETLARSMMSSDVERIMRKQGFPKEADFCRVVREGLFIADDAPGVSAFERCKMRLALMKWLSSGVNFGKFPPYGGSVKGLSNILYEGLRTSQEAKLYLYALAKSGTYCVRAPNTLCSESFFGSMQDMDPWGQGILSSEGVQKHLSDFSTITAMKMEENRNIFIKTKRSTAYPQPEVTKGVHASHQTDQPICSCRQQKMIRCIVPRDHFFDTKERARVYKGDKLYKAPEKGIFRGEQPIRSQYGYKINESRMMPSKLFPVQDSVNSKADE